MGEYEYWSDRDCTDILFGIYYERRELIEYDYGHEILVKKWKEQWLMCINRNCESMNKIMFLKGFRVFDYDEDQDPNYIVTFEQIFMILKELFRINHNRVPNFHEEGKWWFLKILGSIYEF